MGERTEFGTLRMLALIVVFIVVGGVVFWAV